MRKKERTNNSVKFLLGKLKRHDTIVVAIAVVIAVLLCGGLIYISTPVVAANATEEFVENEKENNKLTADKLGEIHDYLMQLDKMITDNQDSLSSVVEKNNTNSTDTMTNNFEKTHTETERIKSDTERIITETEKLSAELMEKIEELDGNLSDVHSDVEKTTTKLDSFRNFVESENTRDREYLEKEFEATLDEIKTLESDYAKAQENNKKLIFELQKVTEEGNEVLGDSLDNKYTSLSTTLVDMDEDMTELHAKTLESFREDISSLENDMNGRFDALEETLAEGKKTILREILESRKEAKDEAEEIKADIENAKNDITDDALNNRKEIVDTITVGDADIMDDAARNTQDIKDSIEKSKDDIKSEIDKLSSDSVEREKNLFEKVKDFITGSETRITTEINDSEKNVTSEIKNSENTVTSEILESEKRITSESEKNSTDIKETITEKITESNNVIEKQIDSKMDSNDKEIKDEIGKAKNEINNRISNSENNTKSEIKNAEDNLKSEIGKISSGSEKSDKTLLEKIKELVTGSEDKLDSNDKEIKEEIGKAKTDINTQVTNSEKNIKSEIGKLTENEKKSDDNLLDKIKTYITGSEKNITDKVEHTGESTADKVNGVVGDKITNMEGNISEKLDDVDKNASDKMDAVNDSIGNRIDEYKDSTNNSIENYSNSTNSNIEKYSNSTNKTIENYNNSTNANIENYSNSTNANIENYSKATNANIENYSNSTNANIENFSNSTNTNISNGFSGINSLLNKFATDGEKNNSTLVAILTEIKNLITQGFGNINKAIASGMITLSNDIANVNDNVTAETEMLSDYMDSINKQLEAVFQSVSNGKRLLASTLLTKGVEVAEDASFQEISEAIEKIPTTVTIEQLEGEIVYEYHYHVDASGNRCDDNVVDASRMGGCFTKAVNHIHNKDCYEEVKRYKYPSNIGVRNDGVAWYNSGNGETYYNYYCTRCESSFTGTNPEHIETSDSWSEANSRATDSKKIETTKIKKVICGMKTSTVAGYAPDCEYLHGQIIGAHIDFTKKKNNEDNIAANQSVVPNGITIEPSLFDDLEEPEFTDDSNDDLEETESTDDSNDDSKESESIDDSDDDSEEQEFAEDSSDDLEEQEFTNNSNDEKVDAVDD
jgi:hypothetical protein